MVQYHAATSGSRRPIPRFYSELVNRVFSGRSSKLSFTQWFSYWYGNLHRFSLRVGRKRDPYELDVAANVLIQLGCKRAKSEQVRTFF